MIYSYTFRLTHKALLCTVAASYVSWQGLKYARFVSTEIKNICTCVRRHKYANEYCDSRIGSRALKHKFGSDLCTSSSLMKTFSGKSGEIAFTFKRDIGNYLCPDDVVYDVKTHDNCVLELMGTDLFKEDWSGDVEILNPRSAKAFKKEK